jgi:alkylation response protein AidB-like acyl-CoA dehydrogenase
MLAAKLEEELQDVARMTRSLAVDKLHPLVGQLERAGTFSTDLKNLLSEGGFFGLVVPQEFGGAQADVRYQVVVLEELARVYPSACTYLTAHWLATKMIAMNAVSAGPTEAIRASWVAPLLRQAATGEALGAIAVTEPDAGSDLGSVSTRATRDGDEWVLDGTKRFITNGGYADFYSVLARTDGPGAKGLSMFFVEADREGVAAARWEEKMGLHGSATAEMRFDGVRVPADHLIGKRAQGFRYLMRCFDEGRLGVAAMAVGISRGALDAATKYAAERRQFGREIAGFQGVQFLIADMAIKVQAGQSLVYDAAEAFVCKHPDAARLVAMAKTYATDASMEVTSDAIQVHGGSGYVRDFPVEMFMRDAKIGQIYEGTNQILRMLIARSYFGDLAR